MGHIDAHQDNPSKFRKGLEQPVYTLDVSWKVVSWTHEMSWHGGVTKKYTDWQRKTMLSSLQYLLFCQQEH